MPQCESWKTRITNHLAMKLRQTKRKLGPEYEYHNAKYQQNPPTLAKQPETSRQTPTTRKRPSPPTLTGANWISKKFSWNSGAIRRHKHIMKNKLTGGYRKRLSGSRAINGNVIFFPDFLFVTGSASRPRLKNRFALTVRQNRLYKPFSVRHLDCFDAPGLE